MRTFLLWFLSCIFIVAKLAEVPPVVEWHWFLVLLPILLSGMLNFFSGFKEGLIAGIAANKHGE